MLDPLSTLFLICFLFGVVFSLISVISGTAHLPLPGGHAFHLGHAGVAHAHAQAGTHQNASPLNFGSLLAFLVWFGGVGYLLHAFSPLALLLVLLLSALAGSVGAATIVFFLFKVLLPAQSIVDPAQYRLDGTSGTITATVPEGGTGEITYTKAGTRRSDAARSIDGTAVPHGEEVVIVTYRRGIAYVQTLKKYLSSPATEIAGLLAALDEQAPISKRGE